MSDPGIRFKLTLHYDGAAFHGWQAQPGRRTVQGALEAAAGRLAGGRRRPVTGAGRTDAGVHATGQVAAVTMPRGWTAGKLSRSLNSMLKGDVWVRKAEAAAAGFHPRRDAVLRSYRYQVGLAPVTASPFHRRWCWPLCRQLDLDAAARAAAALPGEHDFSAFAKSGQPHRGRRCRIEKAHWSEWDGLGAAFEISADRFLHRMVRYLAGTMVDVALGRRGEDVVAALLRQGSREEEANMKRSNGEAASGEAQGGGGRRRRVTSPPAPARGLFLTEVRYSCAD